MLTSTAAFRVGTRLRPPPVRTDDVTLDAPLTLPAPEGPSRLAPMMMLVAIAAVGALMWGLRSGASPSPMTVLLPATMVISTLGLLLQGRGRGAAARLDDRRRRYLEHLGTLSAGLREDIAGQRLSLCWTHPAPSALWTLAGSPRMWERSAADSDFGHVRVGVATQRLSRRIVVPPVGPVDHLDPVTAEALRQFVHAHVTVDDVPIAVALTAVSRIAISGSASEAVALVRSMLCQLATSHPPEEILIAAVVDAGRRRDWEWLKWLPHNSHPTRDEPMVFDAGVGPEELPAAAGRPHLVLIADGADPGPGVDQRVTTVIAIGTMHGDHAFRLGIDAGEFVVGDERFGRTDALTLPEARLCARRLARYRSAVDVVSAVAPGGGELRVPLGRGADGTTVDLDIKETADGGQGPHGLCVGATGSGKSELLRTIVVGLVERHTPDEVNLVLIDFKGGATFLGLDGLNHIAAIITNLSDEAQLVARATDALAGEIHRRQQLLRRAGNAVNLAAYRRSRAADSSLPPLPSLLVVVDEFAELLHQHPDFADLFARIGRVGRSLGVHLLLATQRLDEGRLRGLDSHLSYRICLKTSSAAESRAVLGVADAAELPPTPGAAYLRGADGRLTRFQATYLGAPAPVVHQRAGADARVALFTSVPAPAPGIATHSHRTVMDDLVDRYRAVGSPAHRVWLAPLTRSPMLAELPHADAAPMSAAIGLIDRPFEQRRVPLVVDLGGAGGNVAVVGSPQSGKSQTVRTLVTALATRHDSRRIQFYCLDFGGATLGVLRSLPHVGSVAARPDTELVTRVAGHVEAILRSREAGAADEYGDVVLVVDGWHTLREDFGDLESAITGIATRGLSFGVHVVLTASRWADIRPALKDQIGTRIELRLGDPIDSDMDRKQAALVPPATPGRGVTRDGHHFVIATSDVPGAPDVQAWQAPPVRLLPTVVDHHTVREQSDDHRVLLGIGESGLAPVAVEFDGQAHLLILGDRECGKTATLRVLYREIISAATPDSAQFFVVDYRRTLLDAVDPAYLNGYAFSASAVADRLPALVEVLRHRLPPPDVGVEQLRERSWWSGPDIFVMIDDYDLVAAGSDDGLAALLDLVPHASDVGLRLIVARRHSGLARAMYDPVLTRLREHGCMALLMSGSPEEGAVIGSHRGAPQPPGRGLFVTARGAQRVQVGWCPP